MQNRHNGVVSTSHFHGVKYISRQIREYLLITISVHSNAHNHVYGGGRDVDQWDMGCECELG